jgi:hypothetical protein
MPGPPQVFEMLWNCEFCGTIALLGKTNRFCPQCGAPQNADKRYFPPPGKEVAANTTYEGADRTCPACQTPCGAKANNCKHCGSPLDGSKEVRRQADTVDGKAAPPPHAAAAAPKKSGKKWFAIAGGAVAAVTSLCLVTMFWTKESTATVSGHAWTRTIDVETFGPVKKSAWCDQTPSGAYELSRHREQRSTKKIPDGQDCHTRNVDRGDGTFERREECTTRYREEPVYDDKCDFKVDEWKVARTERAQGQALSPEPQWPTVRLSRTGTCLGCEREASRKETYEVKLTRKESGDDACQKPQAEWARFAVGSVRPVKVRMLGGGVDCDTLQP